MKHTWARSIGFLALAFVVCVALFTALKLVATAIPESALHDSIERSLVTLKEEGGNYHELVAGKEATQLDNFTSALILNMCVNDRADGIEAAFADWYYTSEAGSSDQVAPLESLLTQDIPDDDPRWSSYARYWNGAVVLLKPLLVFLDLAGIRLLFTIVTIVLLLLDAILLARSTSIYSGFAFAVPFTAICLPAATMSLSLAFTFMISAASTLFVIVSFKRRACNVHRWVVPFFLFGAATAFFDMLCTPLITLGIPLAVLVYLGADRWKASGVRDTVVFLLAVVVCWALGYGLLWVAKWVIATIVLGWDVIGNALFAFTYRTSSIGTSDKALRPWSAARINLDALLSLKGWIFSAIMAAAAVVYGIIMRKRLKPVNVRTIVVLLIIAVLPYLWYVFALNHSGVHFRFTYRTQVMTIMCILFALGVMLRPALRDIRDRGKNALAALHQKEVEEAS